MSYKFYYEKSSDKSQVDVRDYEPSTEFERIVSTPMSNSESKDTVIIGNARIDEHDNTTGGSAGDQGREVVTQSWYCPDGGWIVLRPNSPDVAEKIASSMQKACDNNHIGYDQSNRNSLYVAAKSHNWDISKITEYVETDCSALVRVCCACAGIYVNDFTTYNQISILTKTNKFTKYTSSEYSMYTGSLKRGDILVTVTKGHTAVVLSGGVSDEKIVPNSTSTYKNKFNKVIELGKSYEGKYTHYCACAVCNGSAGVGTTASGKKISNGMNNPYYVAANWIKLGSMIKVTCTSGGRKGYSHVYVVADTGGDPHMDQPGGVDIFTPEGHAACYKYGTGNCTCEVLRIGW